MTQHTHAQALILLPHPRRLHDDGGIFEAGSRAPVIALTCDPAALLHPAGMTIAAALAAVGVSVTLHGGSHDDALVSVQIGAGVGQREGYRLVIAADGVRIDADDAAGAFYGAQTLAQIITQCGARLPHLTITDHPDFAVRGVMLDISRDKVPTMATLYQMIDRFAAFKVNQVQLYTEHTFAYRAHRAVWGQASPMTGEQIMALDAYCRDRFIELVPNQNSFGHMHRWFKHKQYLHLAETEVAVMDWFAYPFSLSPAVPGAIDFLDGLYGEMLPNFTSRLFNVGADETFDLGEGRSAALVAEQGKGRVYSDFLHKLYALCQKHGRTMLFWGDIINRYPDLVPELPKDAVALEWGYEADHPFAEKSKLFGESSVPFYVCPGTSSWVSIAGRTDNMIGNIRNAIDNGTANGAVGVLNTDWGDRGHWQMPPVSDPGFAYGAAMSWCAATNRDCDLARALDTFVYGDKAGVMGRLLLDLGNAYKETGVIIHNSSLIHWLYLPTIQDVFDRYERLRRVATLDPLDAETQRIASDPALMTERLHHTLAYVNATVAPLGNARIQRTDADLVTREVTMTARMLRHGIHRGLLQLSAITGEAPGVTKAYLRDDLLAILDDYRDLWLARNRIGGLSDSAARLEEALALYEEGV